jgi:hypothetical protein
VDGNSFLSVLCNLGAETEESVEHGVYSTKYENQMTGKRLIKSALGFLWDTRKIP